MAFEEVVAGLRKVTDEIPQSRRAAAQTTDLELSETKPTLPVQEYPTIKILHVVHGLNRGGLENGVVNLLNGLPPADFRQAVCCLDLRGEMADRIQGNVPVHVLYRGRHNPRVFLRLAALIREWQPDIVHCRNWNTWPDTALANGLARGKRRSVWSFHGFADGDWFPRRRRIASRLLSTVTNELFAVCRDSAQRYAARTGIASDRFQVLYNGVDCDRFHPIEDKSRLRKALGLPVDERIVLTVANLTPVKDHDALVRAAAEALQTGPRRARFVFVGEGKLRRAIEEQVRKLGMQNRVLLPGNSDRVPEYLAAADVFVLPSRLEGMSNAILEAMASGLPVVANQVGGNPELVEHGETGLLCPQGDSSAMVDAIGKLLDDADLRGAMGVAARDRAKRLFSIEAMLASYGNYYRRLVHGDGEL